MGKGTNKIEALEECIKKLLTSKNSIPKKNFSLYEEINSFGGDFDGIQSTTSENDLSEDS